MGKKTFGWEKYTRLAFHGWAGNFVDNIDSFNNDTLTISPTPPQENQ